MTSDFCLDDSFWDPSLYKCERCETRFRIIKGFEFSPNCGLSDRGDQLKRQYKKCSGGSFNNGSFINCQKCGFCAPPLLAASACSAESDAVCCSEGKQVLHGGCIDPEVKTTVITTSSGPFTTTASVTDPTITVVDPAASVISPVPSVAHHPNIIKLTGISICAGILSTLTLVCLILFIKRWRTRHFNKELKCGKGAIREYLPKTSITQSISYNVIKENSNNDYTNASSYNVIAPEVQDAPLKTVLNNLDVLEELVLVLDPDIAGAKNTRHLAAQCSFSFAWINYAYSMKDHKSPLIAVLEGVVTKNPDWTVGHLAGLLNSIDRNDAVDILAKLPAKVED
ncbi:IGF-like family receptor 1 isoform X1 [Xyrauchen texanus]|uniref:IGF-like family receptor 1 isoform X1 n=1 Tax=Xyrauchen texanus TaxID=154827 RepID=UPI002242B5E2|nr:IGF-like family receptor 1 isoform X1 [Xyrauchen texanus]